MDLRDWNRFLWHVVQSRLHRSGRRIYLSFDDTLLSEELKNTGRSVTEESPTVALNAAIQRHCGMMANGCIGLRADEDKPLRRNNWHWVLLPNKSGRSLALVFAAQQILAAEGMRGASFYESYWKAFGATSISVAIALPHFGLGSGWNSRKYFMLQTLKSHLNLAKGATSIGISRFLSHCLVKKTFERRAWSSEGPTCWMTHSFSLPLRG